MNQEIANQIVQVGKKIVDEAAKKIPMDDKIRNMEYLTAIGLLTYYGFDYAATINRAFQTITPNFSHQDFNGIMRQITEAQEIQGKVSDELCLNAFIHRELNDFYGVFLNPSANSFKTELFISDFHLKDNAELLEAFINRMNQYVNSLQTPVYSKNGEFYFRTGIKESSMNSNNINSSVLEETFNKVQSEEIMDKVFELTEYEITDEKIAALLNEIKQYKGRKIEVEEPYKDAALIAMPLYQNPTFHEMMKVARMSGNFSAIENAFSMLTIPGGLGLLSTNMDAILTNNEEERNLAIRRVQALAQTYLQNQNTEVKNK